MKVIKSSWVFFICQCKINVMHSISIFGAKASYWTYGSENSQPIVMVHGFRGTHDGLDLITRELASQFFVISPDLPGFGSSEAFVDQPHDLAAYTEFLNEFIDKLNLKSKPILLGHSFGSIVASSYAAKYQDKISKLILINPIGAPALEGPKAIMSRLALLYYRVGEHLPGRLSHAWLGTKPIVWLMSKMMTKTRDRELVRYIDNQHFTHFSRFKNPRVVSEAFQTSITHDVRQFAPEITLPTRLIVGDRDDITPLNKQRELVKLFPNADLKIIKNVGHLVHYETPSEAANYIKEFSS